jgi:hypothetical protein
MRLSAATVMCGNNYVKNIDEVFDRHVYFLPNDVKYFVFTDEVDVCKEKLQKFNREIEFVCVSLNDNSVHEYNILLTWKGESFWNYFLNFDRVLIFQPDSGLLRPGIEEFYQYDFIGAPLPQNNIAYYPYCCNGGLSLRNPQLMLDICKTYRWPANKGEDLFFSEMMVTHNLGKLPDRNTSAKFSVETEFMLGSLGYHKPWQYLSHEQCQEIYTQYNKDLT